MYNIQNEQVYWGYNPYRYFCYSHCLLSHIFPKYSLRKPLRQNLGGLVTYASHGSGTYVRQGCDSNK